MKSREVGHAVSDQDIVRLMTHIKTLETEDGFPCAHRRPRRYFTEEGLTFKEIHRRYVLSMQKIPARVLSYSRRTQYFKCVNNYDLYSRTRSPNFMLLWV